MKTLIGGAIDEDFDRWCDETIANYKKFAKEFTEKL